MSSMKTGKKSYAEDCGRESGVKQAIRMKNKLKFSRLANEKELLTDGLLNVPDDWMSCFMVQ